MSNNFETLSGQSEFRSHKTIEIGSQLKAEKLLRTNCGSLEVWTCIYWSFNYVIDKTGNCTGNVFVWQVTCAERLNLTYNCTHEAVGYTLLLTLVRTTDTSLDSTCDLWWRSSSVLHSLDRCVRRLRPVHSWYGSTRCKCWWPVRCL